MFSNLFMKSEYILIYRGSWQNKDIFLSGQESYKYSIFKLRSLHGSIVKLNRPSTGKDVTFYTCLITKANGDILYVSINKIKLFFFSCRTLFTLVLFLTVIFLSDGGGGNCYSQKWIGSHGYKPSKAICKCQICLNLHYLALTMTW